MAGQGIALAERVFVEPEIRAGRLAPVWPQRLDTGAGYYLVGPAPRAGSSATLDPVRVWLLEQTARLRVR